MTDEQINEEFEKSLLVNKLNLSSLFHLIRKKKSSNLKTSLNLKSDKDLEKMRILPIDKKKNLLINMRKVNKFLCLNSFVFKNYHLTF